MTPEEDKHKKGNTNPELKTISAQTACFNRDKDKTRNKTKSPAIS